MIQDLKKIEKYYEICSKVNSINKIDLDKLEKAKTGFYEPTDEMLLPIYLDSDKNMLEELFYRLTTSDIYALGVAKDLLSILTYDEVGEKTSIEHIRPQDIKAKDWDKKDYYPIVNNLGNLTLTNYNSVLSNKSFKEKKEIYKMEFPELNKDIIDKESWDYQKTKQRAKRLASEIVRKLFPMELLKREMFQQPTYIVNIFGFPEKHYKINQVILKDRVLLLTNIKDVYSFVVRESYRKDKNKLISLAKEDYMGRITTEPMLFSVCQDINYEVFFRTDLNKYQMLSIIRNLTDEFNLEYLLEIERA